MAAELRIEIRGREESEAGSLECAQRAQDQEEQDHRGDEQDGKSRAAKDAAEKPIGTRDGRDDSAWTVVVWRYR